MIIKRIEYIEKLLTFKDKNLIKVITGIRRCGKSTLFELYIKKLKEMDIQDNQIININLENPKFNFKDSISLYNYIEERLNPTKQNYIFLDEVQSVPEFQKAVNGLHIIKNVDIYYLNT